MSSNPKIIYEDAILLVVEKPAGLPSCPRDRKGAAPLWSLVTVKEPLQSGRPVDNSVDNLEEWLQQQFPEAKLVHRLDNDTSGLMVAAKTETTFNHLRKIWNTDQVVKKYTVLVEGKTPASGTITTPIQHHPRKKKKMVVGGEKARPAHTEYKRLQTFPQHTLLEVNITTGVRHQIRVHFASLGHSVFGDKIYSKEEWRYSNPRQFIHLSSLQLPHPLTNKMMQWQSELPKDLERILNHLRNSK